MSTENSLYSQGFNFGSFIQKGVDPRTGQYTCAITVYDAPAQARNCPTLKLSVNYNPLNPRDIGLGKGWSFNLSSYQHRRPASKKSLSISTGDHYLVTETSSVLAVNDQKLKSFQFKKYGQKDYQIIHKSGQIEVLSNANDTYNTTVPIELYAANGRSLGLLWTKSGEQPRLSKIQEGSQDLLEIKYTGGQVDIIRAPNTTEVSTFTLVRKNDRLVELKLPLEDGTQPSWKFVYETFDQITCLSRVTSPSGLLEEVNHKREGHRLPNRAPYKTIPYVISHIIRPDSQQPPVKTLYSYSDHNFLAYNAGHDWNDGDDNLYRARADYQYTSTVKVETGPQTKYTYNKFHLIVGTEQQQGTKQVVHTITYYALTHTAFKDQPAQYQLPKTVQITYLDTISQASRTETIQHVFDEWGNPTQEIQANGIQTDRIYYLAAGEKNTGTGEVYCPADPHGFRRYLKTETVTPAATAYTTPTQSKQYTYRELPTATGAGTSYFIAAQELQTLQDTQRLSSIEYTYINQPAARDHGRFRQQITRLFGQNPMTRNWTYDYPANTDQLTETTQIKTFDSYTVQDETGYSLSSGLTRTHKDQTGVQARFQYDTIGRLLKRTVSPDTPYEAVRQHEYAILTGEAGYCITVTDAKCVQTRYITDGLGRVRRVEKQDDDGQWNAVKAYSGTFRVVGERNYNALGQCIEAVEIDWLRTNGKPTEQRNSQRLEYDDWAQLCKATNSSGIVTSSLTNPIDLTHTEGVEGEGKTKTQFNLFGASTQMALLKRDGTLCSKVEYFYDGLGRLVKQEDNLGRITEYRIDFFGRVIQTTWPNDRTINTQYAIQSAASLPVSMKIEDYSIGEQAFDGLSRLTSRKVGVHTTTQSYPGSAPKPTQITMPKGDQYHLTYERALGYSLTNLTSSDNANSYQYDTQTAAISQSKNDYSTQDLQYLPSGLVARESIQIKEGTALSAQSSYSMAGKLQCYTDVHGQKHEIQYDGFGRPQHLVQGKLKVTFAYDKTGRLSEGCVQDEENNQSLTTLLSYDDFSREIERTILKGEETLYRLSQTYGKTSLVTTRHLEDGKGNLLRHESFQYDSLNHLIDYQCQGSQPPIDEQGNQLQNQHFSFDNLDNLVQVSTTFQDQSENITQYFYTIEDPTQLIRITNKHPDYPPKIDFAYDGNGCLTRDEQGRTLEYDAMNRLSTVRDAGNQILSQYHYDASGKLVCQMVPEKPDTHLYYQGDTLIAVTMGDCKVSYASDGQVYWGQTLRQDGQTQIQLWASDNHQSILTWLDAQPDTIHHQRYTPYGFSAAGSSIGFNGQWRDPVTGWYHLGNGYRVYNPVPMRFHTPDSWTPFTSGEINAYAYCLGDPINRVDPTGHLSIFGIEFTGRDLTIMGVGLGVGIAVGILTGGAGFAIAAGVDIVAGVASDVATRAIYDLASGKSPTWESVGNDALYGAIGGVSRVLAGGIKAAAHGMSKALGRSASIAITGAESGSGRGMRSLAFEGFRGEILETGHFEDIAYFNSLEGRLGNEGFLIHGDLRGMLLGLNRQRRQLLPSRASYVARYTIQPALRDAEARYPELAAIPLHQRTFTLLSCYGAEAGSGAGQRVADIIGRPTTAFFGRLDPPPGI
ncbi:hypothetical protein L873DRAFT_1815418 [Choiromyces venosus 120613-1]|uniref:Teneurin-like YD-shell domain-containing protein n=1 Tax=Choiromyces venosus 120613-1 TaxID=1336337 RepID=A0A3N4JBB1_9PEZI|nr:hypothetical protein L873DRAFT_1815418 [Choiromyces venosus 120613-1]